MIAFMTANLVARETDWAMRDWGHGDRATSAFFAPLDTYGERIDALLGDVRALGFEAVDLWGAHLHPDWATDEHVAAALYALDRHGLRVATYAHWVGPATLERACRLTRALGADTIGGGISGEPSELAPVVRAHGVRVAIENHPERSTAEVLAKIEASEGTMAATVDTGWWATQRIDPVDAIEELGPHVAHVHLKDVTTWGEPHVTCPWGDGVVDIEACVRALERLGYDGALTIEHEPHDHDPSEECRAMRTALQAWLA